MHILWTAAEEKTEVPCAQIMAAHAKDHRAVDIFGRAAQSWRQPCHKFMITFSPKSPIQQSMFYAIRFPFFPSFSFFPSFIIFLISLAQL